MASGIRAREPSVKLHPTATAPDIEAHPAPPPPGARFSIVIPTWNNRPYLELCLESLRRNSVVPHEVIQSRRM